MTREQLRAAVLEQLSGIAPDIDIDTLDDTVNLRDEYDLDSMDSVNLLTAIHKRLQVNIPDRDYARMHSISELLDYLQQHASG